MTTLTPPNKAHKIATRSEWLAARKDLLKKEKESLRLLDQLAEERRNLPWVKIDKDYTFDSPSGPVTLADLFAGRDQLVIYHFMFGPDWQEGCPSCSFISDHFSGMLPHLAARDVSFTAVSRAPLAKLQAFKQRLGWHFSWVSSGGTGFNTDFHVSFTQEELAGGQVDYNYKLQEVNSTELPGLSVFYKDPAGNIYHTYSTYGRGLDMIMGTYRVLDLVPKGRDEDGLDFSMAWVRYHDRYDTQPANAFADPDKPYWPETSLSAASSPAAAANCGCANATTKAGAQAACA
ncbi:MAG TPA: thioredoxin family protein [Prosthecobacter sp.]|nr:thioredoxin family protein [Prosthecobacter sp.]